MHAKVFMVMPFSDKSAEAIYNHSIKIICGKHNLKIRKADEIFSTSVVYNDIVKEINDASIIIVDISGKNPNVYYELGVAHTIKPKNTIIITHDEYKETPFDIAHFRIIKYEDSIEGKENFEKKLDLTLSSLLSDYATINKEKYDFLINICIASDREFELAIFIGMREYKGLLKLDDNIEVEFSFEDNVLLAGDNMNNFTRTFQKLGFINIENNIVTLSEEGRALSYIIESKGIECLYFNGQTFKDNYVSKLDKIRSSKAGSP